MSRKIYVYITPYHGEKTILYEIIFPFISEASLFQTIHCSSVHCPSIPRYYIQGAMRT